MLEKGFKSAQGPIKRLFFRPFRIGTIRVELLATHVLVVLLSAVAISVGSVVLGLQSGRQQVISQLESVATLKEAEIETWVDTLQTDLATVLIGEDATQRTILLLQTPALSESLGSWMRDRLQQAGEQSGRFEELFLMDLQGQAILSTDATQEGKIHSTQTYFREGLKGPYVNPPFYSPLLIQMVMITTRPVVDPSGQVWGVLAGRANMTTLNEIMLERAGLGETGETYLVGSSHALVTGLRFAQPEEGAFWSSVHTHGVNIALKTQANGSGSYDGYRGEPVVGVYRWLPELRVALLAEQDQSEAFGAIYRTLGVNVGVALASVLLAVVASLFAARGIATPLANLTATATQIAAGDLERTAEVKRKDEIGTLAQAFNSMTAQLRDLISSLEQRVTDRTRGLQTAAEVSRATTSVLDPDQLLRQTVDLVRERLVLYYVGLFLLDEERRFALLQAGTGEAGQKMLAQGHRLEVGGDSMIGQCVARDEARIALDVGEEAARFDNPVLPYTRSEMALPLRSRGRVIGAMTVQSMEEAAFDEADIAVMQTMADQVAVAIDNALLFAEAQAALEEVEVTHRRYLGQAWAEYARGRAVSGYEQTDVGMVPLGEEALPQIQQAMAEHRSVVWNGDPSIGSGQAPRHALRQAQDEARDDADSGYGDDTDLSPSALVAPIMLRGQPIGALGFREEERQWSDDDIALAEAIAEQLALAADNLRLLDETQRRAARERLTGEVTARMRETLDVDTVLQTAAREMREALGLEEVEVRMGTGLASDKAGVDP